MDELGVGFALDGLAVSDLGEEGDDGGAGVTADDGDTEFLGVDASDAGKEAGGTDDVEGSDTEDAAGVVNTSLLQDLGDDGDGGVDGVGDDKEVSLRGDTGNSSGKVANDGGVGL